MRDYPCLFALFYLPLFLPDLAEAKELTVQQNRVIEWSYDSGQDYTDPFRDVKLVAEVTGPNSFRMSLPAFWAGDGKWSFRFSAPQTGAYRFRTVCLPQSDNSLHGQEGSITVIPYMGDNPLYKRGTLKISSDQRHLTHLDGAPFLWLADSWWHGMTTRFSWPEDFKQLAHDRKQKGFNVIQFAVGFPCDIAPFDPRGQNEAGDPWTEEFGTINPAYFDLADLRIQYLVDEGLLPNIVGLWGYYLKFMGKERIKEHWDYLIARYGAYPVTWTLCGEVTLAYYLDLEAGLWEDYKPQFRREWSEIARHIQSHDPYDRLLTVHPGPGLHDGKPPIDDMEALDFLMVQSGHGGFKTLPTAKRFVTRFLTNYPNVPVLHGEVCFEGMHGGGSGEKVQRFLFWTDMLMGTCGFSYGVEGIWQFNTEEFTFGASPSGNVWGNIPWETAHQYPGSTQVGIGKKILESYDWWKLQPMNDRIAQSNDEELFKPYAAGIGDDLRIAYLPDFPSRYRQVTFTALPGNATYKATWIDPITGNRYPIGQIRTTPTGEYTIPKSPIMQDFVFVLQR